MPEPIAAQTFGNAIQDAITTVPWGIIATIVAGVVGSLSPIAAYRYYRRPKPVTGVLPWNEASGGVDLAALGDRSPEDEILFTEEAFAHETADAGAIEHDDRFKTNTRTFHSNDGEVVLPIFVQNRGELDMSEYKMTITFHEEDRPNTSEHQTKILNVHTETLEIDGLFCDPKLFRGHDSDRIPDAKIRQMYRDIGLPGHFVSLVGSLGSGTIESVVLELECQPSVDAFYVLIEIDSPDWFVGEKLFCQRVAVRHDR